MTKADTLICFFAIIGAAAILVVVGCLITALAFAIKDWFQGVKYDYTYKHRFDKPPTAACYCADCKWYKLDHECARLEDHRRWADNWFCFFAEPMTKEQAAKKQKLMEAEEQ